MIVLWTVPSLCEIGIDADASSWLKPDSTILLQMLQSIASLLSKMMALKYNFNKLPEISERKEIHRKNALITY